MSEEIKKGIERAFKTIDEWAEEYLKQKHEGIYVTERDVENVKRMLKSAVLGGLIYTALSGEKNE
jgi:hypothetical protein